MASITTQSIGPAASAALPQHNQVQRTPTAPVTSQQVNQISQAAAENILRRPEDKKRTPDIVGKKVEGSFASQAAKPKEAEEQGSTIEEQVDDNPADKLDVVA